MRYNKKQTFQKNTHQNGYVTSFNKGLPIYIYCVLMFIASVWFSRVSMDWTHIPRVFAMSVCLFISALFLNMDSRPVIKLDVFLIAYWFYFLFYLISISWALNTSEAILDTSRVYLGLMVFLFTVSFFQLDSKRLEKFLPIIGFTIILVGIIVLLAQLRSHPDIKGKVNPAITLKVIYELKGLNGHKNLYAAFNLLALTFCFYGSFFLRGSWKIFSLVGVMLGIGIILFLQTRASWVGLFIILFILFICYLVKYKYFKKVIKLPSLLIVVAASLIMGVLILYLTGGFQGAYSRFIGLFTEGIYGGSGRVIVWLKNIELLQDNWLWGVGAGNWKVFFPSVGLDGISHQGGNYLAFQRPHNDYLWVLTEVGIFGFIFYMFTIIYLIYKSIQTIITSKDSYIVISLSIYFSFYIGYLLMAFFDFPKERPSHIIFSNIIMAIIYCKFSHKKWVSFKLKNKYILIFPALLLFVFCSIMCYYRVIGEKHTRFIQKNINSEEKNIISQKINAIHLAYHPLFYTLDPTSNPIKYYLGNQYVKLGYLKKGLEELEKAYEQNPYSTNLLMTIGNTYVNLGTKYVKMQDAYREKSISFLKEGLRISPINQGGRSLLVQVLYVQKKYEEAKKYAFEEKYIFGNKDMMKRFQALITYQLNLKEQQITPKK